MKYWIIGIVVVIFLSAVMFNKRGASDIVRDGDTVIIDFAGTVDGVAFDGGTATDYELIIGSKSFVDNFEEQIIGMKVGETKNVEVTFPKDYVKELAGKKAVFKTTLKAIK